MLVTIYSEPDKGGEFATFKAGTYTNAQVISKFKGTKIGSIEVPAGLIVEYKYQLKYKVKSWIATFQGNNNCYGQPHDIENLGELKVIFNKRDFPKEYDYYKIINKKSGKAVSVKNESKEANEILVQEEFKHKNHQIFVFEFIKENQFKILNLNSKMVIQIGKDDHLLPKWEDYTDEVITQTKQIDKDHQTWNLELKDNGYFLIENAAYKAYGMKGDSKGNLKMGPIWSGRSSKDDDSLLFSIDEVKIDRIPLDGISRNQLVYSKLDKEVKIIDGDLDENSVPIGEMESIIQFQDPIWTLTNLAIIATAGIPTVGGPISAIIAMLYGAGQEEPPSIDSPSAIWNTIKSKVHQAIDAKIGGQLQKNVISDLKTTLNGFFYALKDLENRDDDKKRLYEEFKTLTQSALLAKSKFMPTEENKLFWAIVYFPAFANLCLFLLNQRAYYSFFFCTEKNTTAERDFEEYERNLNEFSNFIKNNKKKALEWRVKQLSFSRREEEVQRERHRNVLEVDKNKPYVMVNRKKSYITPGTETAARMGGMVVLYDKVNRTKIEYYQENIHNSYYTDKFTGASDAKLGQSKTEKTHRNKVEKKKNQLKKEAEDLLNSLDMPVANHWESKDLEADITFIYRLSIYDRYKKNTSNFFGDRQKLQEIINSELKDQNKSVKIIYFLLPLYRHKLRDSFMPTYLYGKTTPNGNQIFLSNELTGTPDKTWAKLSDEPVGYLDRVNRGNNEQIEVLLHRDDEQNYFRKDPGIIEGAYSVGLITQKKSGVINNHSKIILSNKYISKITDDKSPGYTFKGEYDALSLARNLVIW